MLIGIGYSIPIGSRSIEDVLDFIFTVLITRLALGHVSYGI